MSNNNSTNTSLLEFGGFTVPAGCRRIFITAELEPSNGDPRIQPTGFPDIGPVLYPDPSGQHGLICLIESEASMANRLEEVCLADKYTGVLKPTLSKLPYIKLTQDGKPDGVFKTSSSIDGHRFASEYIMGAKGHLTGTAGTAEMSSWRAPADKNKEMVELVKSRLGMPSGDSCPAANVPEIFRLAMEYDPLALIHGFQISVKNKLTFVGLRSARALTASIVGLNCERVSVPGIRFDPIGTGDAGQAIFQKQRVTAGQIEGRFSIDVGLLASLRLDAPKNGSPGPYQNTRLQLLLAIALWKVAAFLDLLRVELSLRTECKLRLKDGKEPQYKAEGGASPTSGNFLYSSINAASFAGENGLIAGAHLPSDRDPLVLSFT